MQHLNSRLERPALLARDRSRCSSARALMLLAAPGASRRRAGRRARPSRSCTTTTIGKLQLRAGQLHDHGSATSAAELRVRRSTSSASSSRTTTATSPTAGGCRRGATRFFQRSTGDAFRVTADPRRRRWRRRRRRRPAIRRRAAPAPTPFTVQHNDRIGELQLPAGQYRITLLAVGPAELQPGVEALRPLPAGLHGRAAGATGGSTSGDGDVLEEPVPLRASGSRPCQITSRSALSRGRSSAAAPARGWSRGGRPSPPTRRSAIAARSTGRGRCPRSAIPEAAIVVVGLAPGGQRREPHRADVHRGSLGRLAVRGAAPRRPRQPAAVDRTATTASARAASGSPRSSAARRPTTSRRRTSAIRCLPYLDARAGAAGDRPGAGRARLVRLGRGAAGAGGARATRSRARSRASGTARRRGSGELDAARQLPPEPAEHVHGQADGGDARSGDRPREGARLKQDPPRGR